MGGSNFSWESLLGNTLLGQDGESVPVSKLDEKEVVAIYFSAHWCPPCRGFTPKLAEWYTKSLSGKGMEVVFVSSDQNQAAFNGYFKEMPWLAVPFADRDVKNALSAKFGVQGIPMLVLLDAKNGAVIDTNGRGIVSQDATGANFPWKKTEAPANPAAATSVGAAANTFAWETLLGNELLVKNSKVSTAQQLADKEVVAIYFSAHWCPPCRGFTPKLAEWYTTSLAKKGMEVVFVSSDQNEAAFASYFKEMPWSAVPFSAQDIKSKLGEKFGVSGIPCLVLLNARDGSVISLDGRSVVSQDPTGLKFLKSTSKNSSENAGSRAGGAAATDKSRTRSRGLCFGIFGGK